jgi:FixJ family two-component response regulator
MDLTAKTFAFGQHFLSYNGPSDTACIVADVQIREWFSDERPLRAMSGRSREVSF